MNTPASGTSPAFAARIAETETPLRGQVFRWLWCAQSLSLLLLTIMTFFPAWSHVQEYVFLSLFLTGCSAAYGEGRRIIVPSAMHLPIVLWLGWILLSVPYALDPAYSFSEWRKIVVKVLWFYWVTLVLRHSEFEDMPRKVLTAVAVGSFLISGYALMDFVQRGGTGADRLIRARAPSSDYNWLSSYLVMSIPLAIVGLLSSSRRLTATLFGGVTMVTLLAQLLSYTRAGWLALLSQGLAAGIYLRRFALISGFLFALVIGVAFVTVIVRPPYHQDTQDTWTLEARLAVWSLMLHEIQQHPLMGIGYGTNTFMMRFGDRPETTKAQGSHNLFLMTAMGSGVPAVTFLIWLFAVGIRECLHVARRSTDPFTSALGLAVALMIIGVMVRNLFDVMFLGSLACLFWLLLATGLAQARRVPPVTA